MKRLIALITVLFCICGLCVTASARSSANELRSDAMVTSDGICSVTISLSMTLDEAAEPQFPIPTGASDVTLNGHAVSVSVGNRANLVNLKSVTGGLAGTHSMVITYRLSGAVVAQKNGTMLLTLPLLCGFAYPVDSLKVTVTLPGEITEEPELHSGYYQDNASQVLDTVVSGSSITITSRQTVLDRETLTLTLRVDERLFPSTAATARVLGVIDIFILGSILLAAAYYLLALWPVLPRKILRSTVPDGVTAGHVPVWLTGGATDMSMLVVSWAQLGYLRIQVEAGGRVLLHKRMEMGNERSNFENRCYKNLFGRRHVVDGTGDHYARMVRSVAKQRGQVRDVYRRSSGNPYIFRALCALSALLSGVTIGGVLAPHSVFIQILLAAVTTVLGYLIQSGARALLLRNKLPLWIAAGCAGLWLVLGVWSGELVLAVLMVALQFLAGLLASYGGKRTELGQQALTQLLGLRKFMCTVPKQEVQRLMKINSGYFHELMPYALALGVDHLFARRFAKIRLPDCTYLIVDGQGQMSASQWASVLRKTVDTLDAKAKKLPLDQLMGR